MIGILKSGVRWQYYRLDLRDKNGTTSIALCYIITGNWRTMQHPNGSESNVKSIQEEIYDLERRLEDAKQRLNRAQEALSPTESLTPPGTYHRPIDTIYAKKTQRS